MAKKVVTNDGKKGGWLVGKRHYDKDGKPLGGIKALVTDAGGKPVELEGGEVIINREASKKYWKELSKINQSAGNGVAIGPPSDSFDEDPSEDYENGGKIEFNANHIPNKWILNYAIKIKENHPEIWKLGGNIFGNEAFVNLKRVAERGHWLDSEEWMYKKWRSYVARHQRDYRIEGVVAMLKWVDKVEKGWQYMKNLIEEEIKKREARNSKKMIDGGNVDDTRFLKVDKYILNRHPKNGDILKGGKYQDYEIVAIKKQIKVDKITFNLWLKKGINRRIVTYIPKTKKISDFIKVQKGYAKGFRYDEWSDGPIGKQMRNGGNVSKTPAPLKDRIKGSKFNPSGTAKDAKSGTEIKFDDKTISSIKSLIDAHNEKYPSKKITLGVAKAVVRRGMGAYSSSYRPTISGGKPNSRTAWGLARLKAFIYKAEKGNSKSGKYSQDNDLFGDLDIKVSKFVKGGKILNEEEEQSFKEWMEDGNVHKFEDGYSTQDAQWRNRLKGLDELRKYFRKEFLSDNYGYADGGNINDKKIVVNTSKSEIKYTNQDIQEMIDEIDMYIGADNLPKWLIQSRKNGNIDFPKDKKEVLKLLKEIKNSKNDIFINVDSTIPSFKHFIKMEQGGKLEKQLETIEYKGGGKVGGGDCYKTAGDFVLDSKLLGKTRTNQMKFVGEPYVVHAEVSGQGEIRGLKYGHAWVEDDVLVYDYSNGRKLEIPKNFYYAVGKIKTTKPRYFKYTFEQARKKMLDSGHYGPWDLKTESGL